MVGNWELQDKINFVLAKEIQYSPKTLLEQNKERYEKRDKVTLTNNDLKEAEVRCGFFKQAYAEYQKYAESAPSINNNELHLRTFLQNQFQSYPPESFLQNYLSLENFQKVPKAAFASSFCENLHHELSRPTPKRYNCSYKSCNNDLEQLFALQPGEYTFFAGYYFVFEDCSKFPNGDPNRKELNDTRKDRGKSATIKESVCLTVLFQPLFEEKEEWVAGQGLAFLEGDVMECVRVEANNFYKPFSYSLGKIIYAILLNYFQAATKVRQRSENLPQRLVDAGFQQNNNAPGLFQGTYHEHPNRQDLWENVVSWARASYYRVAEILKDANVRPASLFHSRIKDASIAFWENQPIPKNQLLLARDTEGKPVQFEKDNEPFSLTRMLLGITMGVLVGSSGYLGVRTFRNAMASVTGSATATAGPTLNATGSASGNATATAGPTLNVTSSGFFNETGPDISFGGQLQSTLSPPVKAPFSTAVRDFFANPSATVQPSNQHIAKELEGLVDWQTRQQNEASGPLEYRFERLHVPLKMLYTQREVYTKKDLKSALKTMDSIPKQFNEVSSQVPAFEDMTLRIHAINNTLGFWGLTVPDSFYLDTMCMLVESPSPTETKEQVPQDVTEQITKEVTELETQVQAQNLEPTTVRDIIGSIAKFFNRIFTKQTPEISGASVSDFMEQINSTSLDSFQKEVLTKGASGAAQVAITQVFGHDPVANRTVQDHIPPKWNMLSSLFPVGNSTVAP